MRKFALALAATTAFAATAGAATAQEWMPINLRQDMLERRIEAGIRSGDLTRVEARTLRADFDALARLEARYRINGLSNWERSDLDRRFDVLSSRIRMERADHQDRNWYGGRGWTDNRGQWVSIERRKAQLERRILQGERSGQLTERESMAMRADFEAILQWEQRYRRDGRLTMEERAALDQRFDRLADRIRVQRRDGQSYGYNRY